MYNMVSILEPIKSSTISSLRPVFFEIGSCNTLFDIFFIDSWLVMLKTLIDTTAKPSNSTLIGCFFRVGNMSIMPPLDAYVFFDEHQSDCVYPHLSSFSNRVDLLIFLPTSRIRSFSFFGLFIVFNNKPFFEVK